MSLYHFKPSLPLLKNNLCIHFRSTHSWSSRNQALIWLLFRKCYLLLLWASAASELRLIFVHPSFSTLSSSVGVSWPFVRLSWQCHLRTTVASSTITLRSSLKFSVRSKQSRQDQAAFMLQTRRCFAVSLQLKVDHWSSTCQLVGYTCVITRQ